MRICILTQPLCANYGGLLQAYALQTVLKRMGHNVMTEDRRCSKLTGKKAWESQIKRLLGPIRKRYYPSQKDLIRIRQNTDRFIREHITTTEPIYSNTKEEFQKYNFDTYIVGSDQVWRPRYSPCITNYFLDFTVNQDVKRIAYAASFGTGEWEFSDLETKECSQLVKNFDAISVREDSGVRLCKDYLGVEAVHVLDPTMLLEKNDYMKLLGKSRQKKSSDKKLMTYILDKSPEKDKMRETVIGHLKIRSENIIEPMPAQNFSTCGPTGIKDCVYPSVEDWIQGFADADFVITDSFHGTVFSLIFNVPFITIVNATRGADRFISLTNMFGLQDQLITSLDEDIINKLIETSIDFTPVNEKITEARRISMSFLEDALKNI